MGSASEFGYYRLLLAMHKNARRFIVANNNDALLVKDEKDVRLLDTEES